MKAILLVDHGSIRKEANEMLIDMAKLVQSMAGDAAIIEYAHMELAEPTIAQGISKCVEAGATDVTVFPLHAVARKTLDHRHSTNGE